MVKPCTDIVKYIYEVVIDFKNIWDGEGLENFTGSSHEN